MAAQADEMDQIQSASRRHARIRPAQSERAIAVRGDGRWYYFSHAATGAGDRDHRTVRAQAVRVLLNTRRRHIRNPARIRTRYEGSDFPGCYRSAYADCAGLAARLAPQARP